MRKTDKAIQQARLKLVRAIGLACCAQGEAQWTNGYRTGAHTEGAEDDLIYAKEMVQWHRSGVAGRTADRAITRYARLIRESFNPMRKKRR